MKEEPETLRHLLNFDHLLKFIRYVLVHSEEELRVDMKKIVLDRELTMLGRMVVMVRTISHEKFEEFGAPNACIITKLDLLAAKVGHFMPKHWRQ